MPFTLAHPAAALLFRRSRLMASGLVVGCMAPDLEYFLRLRPGGGFSHTLPGIMLMDLPLGLVALWLYMTLLREPLVALLPAAVRERIAPWPRQSGRWLMQHLPEVAISIVLGALTHLMWDSFTHNHMWLYRHWSLLATRVNVPLLGVKPLFMILQHGSSLLGCAVLLGWVRRWYRQTPVRMEAEPRGFLLRYRMQMAVSLVLLTVICTYGYVGVVLLQRYRHTSLDFLVAETVICTMSFFTLGLLAWGILGRVSEES